MTENALKQFRRYGGISECWELVKTGLVVISDTTYRLELWHSYSNPDVPYYVAVYIQQDGVWKKMPNAPFPVATEPELALGTAMAFLSERAA